MPPTTQQHQPLHSPQSGNPEFIEISYLSVTANTSDNRAGWRFFKASTSANNGTLGWDLHTRGFRQYACFRRTAARHLEPRNPAVGGRLV
jgi:hypothetical protein